MILARSSTAQRSAPRPATRSPRLRHLPGIRIATLAAGLFAAATVTAELRETQEMLLRRYPFDPACPFGRISNGKGMVVRCITEEESGALLKRSPAATAPRAPEAAPTAASGGAAATSPVASAGTAAVEPSPPASTDTRLEVTVGPIVADQGELSLTKLTRAKDKFERCVLDNGGLRGKSGEVHVRFLVRSRGIAEGVSAQPPTNVSADAARCVAEVVDRRHVGIPDAPLVGATLTVKFEKVAK